MSKLPATKSRRPLASLNQQAATLAAGDINITPTAIVGNNFQTISGSNNIQINGDSNIIINSDEVIIKLLDLISQQTDKIGELTDKVISQASEIVNLKLKLNGLQL